MGEPTLTNNKVESMAEKYCKECGTKLTEKELEGDGMVPYCENCNEFRFPGFNVAVIMIVIDKKTDKILLIKQYGRPFYILVAGYVNKGESAETAVAREIKEETGLNICGLRFNRTKYFEPSNALMCNFTAFVEDGSLIDCNSEIDEYAWFTRDEAVHQIKDQSLAKKFLVAYLDEAK